ncbi:Phosphoethanolamine N-methyltransferase 3 [Madurella mycetomatis]|uniref:Phosphoethanolamine N-methyltransferase 3 n=1 Tax=Madurella mycetomatis TaxID=100816 RepID=A0A175VNR7_9PEZI|nr:Phosphoethanolamine N-methyltransferase 3 [Madurella mycetomatis]
MASSGETPALLPASDTLSATPTPGIAVDPSHENSDGETDSLLENDMYGARSASETQGHPNWSGARASSTTSLSESIMKYRKIHGRTFHNFNTETEYWGPNDELQNEHLDLNHQMLLVAMNNKLYFAPIGDSPQRVIDIGTGTGIWALDFADQFPSAEVIGTDLSPTQPSWVPPNCKFELDDAQLPWTYPDNYFDFIHLRLMMGSIQDWPALYKEAYRCLKPGGWIEHMDNDLHVVSDDGSVRPDSAWSQWAPLFVQAGERLGRTFATVGNNVGWMKEVGFQNIQERRLKLPLGGWPADPRLKEVGYYNLAATESGLEGFALYVLTQVHKWNLEQTQMYLAAVRKELRSRTNHAYYEA